MAHSVDHMSRCGDMAILNISNMAAAATWICSYRK